MGNRVAAPMTRAGGHRVTRTVAATIGVAGTLFTRVASRTGLAHQRLRRRAARGALGSAPGAKTDRGAARAVASLFVVIGLTTPSPTIAGMESQLSRDATAIRALTATAGGPLAWMRTLGRAF